MAEWFQGDDDGVFYTRLAGHRLMVYQGGLHGGWRMMFSPIIELGSYRKMEATTAESAQLEALHIVGEWGKQVAVEAAELRGRMVGATMNASYYTDWINEDELPEGYPYNLAFGRSVMIDGVRMFPPWNEGAEQAILDATGQRTGERLRHGTHDRLPTDGMAVETSGLH